ncbi:MAG: sporulation protein SpoIID, partial [Oscillospiraceae bacterium]
PLAPAGQPQAGTYTITGNGWGHHVGMSQWGAYAMAQLGLNYMDILNFYFTGIEIK